MTLFWKSCLKLGLQELVCNLVAFGMKPEYLDSIWALQVSGQRRSVEGVSEKLSRNQPMNTGGCNCTCRERGPQDGRGRGQGLSIATIKSLCRL